MRRLKEPIFTYKHIFWISAFIFLLLISRGVSVRSPLVYNSKAADTTITQEITVCALKNSGDADCNGKIDLIDFEIFRKEFLKILSTMTADFDNNGQVTVGDFETWRKGYFAGGAVMTPTPTSVDPTTEPTVTIPPTATPTSVVNPTITPTGTSGTTLIDRMPELFAFAATQLTATTQKVSATGYPNSTNSAGDWNTSSASSWTSGFFPGALWLMYEKTQAAVWKTNAEKWTAGIESQKNDTSTHDLGFMFFDSFGNGYRLTNNANYKSILLAAARSLATRYSATVGCIKSWDGASNEYKVIIDNMMNLELLFWASKNGGEQAWYDMALSHAVKTSQNHIRPDGSTYHVVIYDPANGSIKSRVTAQGFADSSTWSRGQAWAIYGFSIAYRETNDARFLETARKTADYFISHLPADFVPYWDFQAPGIPNEPRDSSAAAIAASGLLELSKLETDSAKKTSYANVAEKILTSLSQAPYIASGTKYKSILIHGTQNKPSGKYDTGLIYGDYYYLESLLKYQKIP